jgi:(R,R)-butanediol dehydrogenase/meso-butanediol dehydrogenase/diacetyl reductase
VSVGQRVFIDPLRRCGACLLCRAATPTYYSLPPYTCDHERLGHQTGMLAEQFLSRADQCRAVPEHVTDRALANVEPFACGTRDVRHSGLVIGDNVVFLGLDDYALAAMQWARRAANQVVVVDPVAARRTLAARVGADVVVDPGEQDPVAVVREVMPFGADVVFVSTEQYLPRSLDYFAEAVHCVRIKGTIVNVRLYASDALARIDTTALWFKEPAIRQFGSFWSDESWRGGWERGDFQLTLDAVRDGRLDAESYVEDVRFDDLSTADDVAAVFRALPSEIVKAHVTF